jgi:hypothetical protein
MTFNQWWEHYHHLYKALIVDQITRDKLMLFVRQRLVGR